MANIADARILILATHGFEQSELVAPMEALRTAGATVEVAAPEKGKIRGWREKDWGESVTVDKSLDEVQVRDYDVLLLPGGVINPDLLRINLQALQLIRAFVNTNKIVAAICHAPWLLIEVGAVRGRRLTSYRSIKTDIKNAGGRWYDQKVVVDNGIITGRSPKDIDAFVAKIIEEIQAGAYTPRSTAAA